MTKPAVIMFGLVLTVLSAACASPVPLGDGSLVDVRFDPAD